MKNAMRLALLLLILGAAPCLAAPMLGEGPDPDQEPGAIMDDPDPAGIKKEQLIELHERIDRNVARMRALGWFGQVRIEVRGDTIVATDVALPTACPKDKEDCEAMLDVECQSETGYGVRPLTVNLEVDGTCSGQCATIELVMIELVGTCPAVPEPGPVKLWRVRP